MEDEDLICAALDKWFSKNSNSRDKWNNNKIGKKIKSIVKSLGNWKGKARWKPPSSNLHDNIKNKETEDFADMFDNSDNNC